jgi:hypothetical protein
MERTLTALKGNSGGVCELMKDRDSVAEDAHQCYYCTDFAYMSLIQCKLHKISYCISHQIMCECPPSNINVIYRYSTKELMQLETSINEACN